MLRQVACIPMSVNLVDTFDDDAASIYLSATRHLVRTMALMDGTCTHHYGGMCLDFAQWQGRHLVASSMVDPG